MNLQMMKKELVYRKSRKNDQEYDYIDVRNGVNSKT